MHTEQKKCAHAGFMLTVRAGADAPIIGRVIGK